MFAQPQDNKSDLAKLATIFAVVFGIAFGLCSVSGTVGMSVSEKLAGFLVMASVFTEIVCLIGLVVTGIIATIRAIRR